MKDNFKALIDAIKAIIAAIKKLLAALGIELPTKA